MKTPDSSGIQRSLLRFKRMRDYAEAIVQAVREPLVVLDSDLRIKTVNQAFCQMFDLSALETHNRLIYRLASGHWKFRRLRPLLIEMLGQESPTPQCEVNSFFTGQEHRTMLMNARKIQGENPLKPLILLSIEDISEQTNAQKALEKLIQSFKQDSLRDVLTGLYNRRGFESLGTQYLKIGRRMGKSSFVLFVDVDALKQINDQKGHAEGDRALVQAAEILKKTFRHSDVVARIGGDEFAIVTIEQLPGSIAAVMKRLKRRSVQLAGHSRISFSAGIAYSEPTDTSTIEELLAKADAAMYIAKQQKSKDLDASPTPRVVIETSGGIMNEEKDISKKGQGFNDARGEVPDLKDIPSHNGQNVNNDPVHEHANAVPIKRPPSKQK